jgi:hypothetical protein
MSLRGSVAQAVADRLELDEPRFGVRGWSSSSEQPISGNPGSPTVRHAA